MVGGHGASAPLPTLRNIWLASRPQVASVIAGATRVEQIEANVKAIEWRLSAEEIAEIDGITKA
jgi:aryl-alcohol dehydrogenase-like predicted oxidoreductase